MLVKISSEEYASVLTNMLTSDSHVLLSELRPLATKTRHQLITELEALGYEIPGDALTTELAMILQEEEDNREAYLKELKEAQAWEETFYSPSEEGQEEGIMEEYKEEEKEEKEYGVSEDNIQV